MARDLMEAVKKCRGSFVNFTGGLSMVSGAGFECMAPVC